MKTITNKDFFSKDALECTMLVDQYEGDQRRYVTMMLDGKLGGMGARENWKERGIIPRTRNIVKPIVDKSGLLFNKPPQLFIQPPNSTELKVDPTFAEIMHSADWIEFFHNVDVYTRLLKTTVILQTKYVPEETTTNGGVYKFNPTVGEALFLVLLHQGNTVVKMDAINKNIVEIAFLTSNVTKNAEGNDSYCYRDITKDEITDWEVNGDVEKMDGAPKPNHDGIVPASFVYDINKPRSGVWCEPPEDMLDFQFMTNLAHTDMEFAVAWNKIQQLFVTADILATDDTGSIVSAPGSGGSFTGGQVSEQLLGAQATKKTTGGLGSIVRLKADDQGNPPTFEYKGPKSDLDKLFTIQEGWVKQIAEDWCVTLKSAGGGAANSGFQLVVEELDNLNLREKRAFAFSAGLRRFYEVTRKLYPELMTGTLIAEFAPPSLPVNQKEQEEMWDKKIAGNRASRLDYFMEVKGMTEEEAIKKMQDIIAANKLVNDALNPIDPEVEDEEDKPTDETDDSQE